MAVMVVSYPQFLRRCFPDAKDPQMRNLRILFSMMRVIYTKMFCIDQNHTMVPFAVRITARTARATKITQIAMSRVLSKYFSPVFLR